MLNITINDRNLQVEEGLSILEVAQREGIKIPTICYHKELTPYGACRLCLVEIVGGARPGIEASCLYKVTEGLVVKTDTERVVKTRKIMLELLLARCPDSPVIRRVANEYGVTETRIKLKERPDSRNCMLCGLCVRVCAEVSQRQAISFSGRGARRTVQTPFNKVSAACIGCGACAYLCPIVRLPVSYHVGMYFLQPAGKCLGCAGERVSLSVGYNAGNYQGVAWKQHYYTFPGPLA